MEEITKKKKRTNKVGKGTEPYEQLLTLIEILKENRAQKNIARNKRIYLFNELDLMLAKEVDVKLLIKCAQYRHNGLETVSKFKNFDAVTANEIEKVNSFLQELEDDLQERKIDIKYEYYIDGKIIIPSEEQEQFVKTYLKENNIPLNDRMYSIALRRLIVGGDIQSKFSENYFMDRTEGRKKNQESSLNV